MKRLLLFLVALALLASSCGSSDDEVATSSSSANDDTAGDVGPENSSSVDLPEEGSGADTDFCSVSDQLDAAFAEDFSLDADSVKDYFEKVKDQLNSMADDAPSEIRDDVRTLADAYNTLTDVLKENDYNFLDLPEGAVDALSDPEIETAGERIAAFCGLDAAAADSLPEFNFDDLERLGLDELGLDKLGLEGDELEAFQCYTDKVTEMMSGVDLSNKDVLDEFDFGAIIEECGLDPSLAE